MLTVRSPVLDVAYISRKAAAREPRHPRTGPSRSRLKMATPIKLVIKKSGCSAGAP